MADAVHRRWSELTADVPMPKLDRKRLIGEKMMLSLVRLDKGCIVPTHAHENEQFTCILKGCLRFTLGAEGAPDRRTLDVRADEEAVSGAQQKQSRRERGRPR